MAIDEADEDVQDQQADLRILHQREGEQRVQEGRRQGRQHVGGLEAHSHLQADREGVAVRRRDRERWRQTGEGGGAPKQMEKGGEVCHITCLCYSVESGFHYTQMDRRL